MQIILDLQISESIIKNNKALYPHEQQMHQWLSLALLHGYKQLNIESPDCTEITIRITDEQEITELNNTYRHINKATNILSFPYENPEHIPMDLLSDEEINDNCLDTNFLGDLVICYSIIEQEALEQKKEIFNHWAHIIIHGSLHLLGFDHINDDDAEHMEALEIKVLDLLNIDNPYLIT